MNNILSVDLGTQQDPTAFSLLSRVQKFKPRVGLPGTPQFMEEDRELINEIQLRFLERPPIKTTYPEIIERTKQILNNPQLAGDCFLVVDATGVGLPVLQMMREQGLAPIGIVITGGNNVSSTSNGFNVPKRDIVISLQTALQSGRLKIAKDIPLAKELINEAKNFKVKITKSGNDTYEAWRESIHDDIIMSVAQGVWYFNKIYGTQSNMSVKAKEKYDPFNF